MQKKYFCAYKYSALGKCKASDEMQKLCWNFACDGFSVSLLSEEHVSYTKLKQIFQQTLYAKIFPLVCSMFMLK